VADNWIHEGFASYAEVLFTECEFGKEAGNDYCEGVKKSIENDIPLIGNYNVKSEGSGDIYNKGSQIIHMIRQLVDDDEKFRTLLRDISKKFYHKIISTKECEDFISLKTGKDLKAFFNQYLRHTKVPKLEYKIVNSKLKFRYTNCINEFNMPLKIKTDRVIWIYPKTQWQSIIVDEKIKKISIDRNFFVK
jgi:aminopeptidase N